MTAKKKYEWKITVKKAAKYLLMFGIPTVLERLVEMFPEYSGITVGAVIVAIANYMKNKD